MNEKASASTMGYPVTIFTHHSLRNLLNHSKYTLTALRIKDYHRILDQEDVTLPKCSTINPADTLLTSEKGELHACPKESERYSKLRSDLQTLH